MSPGDQLPWAGGPNVYPLGCLYTAVTARGEQAIFVCVNHVKPDGRWGLTRPVWAFYDYVADQ